MKSYYYGKWCRYAQWIPEKIFYQIFKFPKNLIFIWIPKSAGTSIADFFERQGFNFHQIKTGEEGFLKLSKFKSFGYQTFGHLSLEALVKNGLLKKKYVNESLLVSVIRDPVDRFLSLYFYYKKIGVLEREKIKTPAELMQQIQTYPPNQPGLFNWIKFSQCRPQTDWLPENQISKIKFLRFTYLDQDFGRLCQDLKLPTGGLPRENTSQREDPFLDLKTRDRITEYYESDFRLLSQMR